MKTLTKPNKHTLARRAWPQTTDRLIYCTINGVDMVSVSGYHASVLTPQYAYIGKMHTANLPSNPAKLDFEVSTERVEIMDRDDQFVTLTNGIKLNADYADYYLDAFPGAQWYSNDPFRPIAIVHKSTLVAVIMPVRS